MHSVNDRTRAKEQQRLKERVRHHVKDRHDERPNACGQEHKPELRDGRIGEDFLDIVLRDRDRRCKQRRRRTDHRDDPHRRRSQLIDSVRPDNEINARCNHRRGVDECRHRRRTGHSVGKPRKQRDLGRLTSRPNKEQHANRRQPSGRYRSPSERVLMHVLEHKREHALHLGTIDSFIKERDRTCQRKDEKDTDQHAPVADAVHYKGFLGRLSCLVLLNVIADQQVRAQAHAFPTYEHQQVIVRENKRQHREHEQVQIGKEPVKSRVALHITCRKNMDQQPDERNKTHVNAGQAVHAQRKIRAKSSDLNPCPDVVEYRLIRMQRTVLAKREHKRHDRRNDDRPARDCSAEQFILQSSADEPIDNGPHQRREDDYA